MLAGKKMLFPWLLLILLPSLSSPAPENRQVRLGSEETLIVVETLETKDAAAPDYASQPGCGPCKKVIQSYDRRRRAASAELRRRKRETKNTFPMKLRMRATSLPFRSQAVLRRCRRDADKTVKMHKVEADDDDIDSAFEQRSNEFPFFVLDYDSVGEEMKNLEEDIVVNVPLTQGN